MSGYFDHHFISNSDLKLLRKTVDPKFEDPADLEEIFKFGTLFHALVLEPHKADRTHPQLELAERMAKTFMKDPLAQKILMIPDLKREQEFYRTNRWGGADVRCKADLYSKSLKFCGELKGLKVNSESQLEEAMDRFDYDQAVAWYLDITEAKHYLIGAVSKTTDKIFKRYVDRNHPYYKRGIVKVEKAVRLYREMFPSQYTYR
jgi:hypothetical protein